MNAIFYITFTILSGQFLFAQTPTASTFNSPQNISSDAIDWANFENEMAKMGEDNWTFHTDQESKLLYIDFGSRSNYWNKKIMF